jgi:hypothetical protein
MNTNLIAQSDLIFAGMTECSMWNSVNCISVVRQSLLNRLRQ